MMNRDVEFKVQKFLDDSLDVPAAVEARLARSRAAALGEVNSPAFNWHWVADCFGRIQYQGASFAVLACVFGFTLWMASIYNISGPSYMENIELLSSADTLPIIEQDVEFYLWLAEQDL